MEKAIKPRSEKVLDLLERATRTTPNEVVTFDDWSEACGCNVRGEAYWALRSMLRIAEREAGIVFESVRGVGLRRIVNGEQIAIAEKGFQKTGRATTRIIKTLETTEVEKLSRPKKSEYSVALTTAQILRQFTNSRRYVGIKKAVVNNVFKTTAEACKSTYEKQLAAFEKGTLRQPHKA